MVDDMNILFVSKLIHVSIKKREPKSQVITNTCFSLLTKYEINSLHNMKMKLNIFLRVGALSSQDC